MRLIDADAMLDALYDNEFQTFCPLDEVSGVIAASPTLDYEPVRHGEWMNNVDENGFLLNAWRKCSVCGGLNYSKKPSYCPNCGAKMDSQK